MAHAARHTRLESSPNVTPLVDVVMVLLIFLMLVGTFVHQQHYLATSTPTIDRTAGPPAAVPAEPLMLWVDPVADGGFPTMRIGSLTTRDPGAMGAHLKSLKSSMDSIGQDDAAKLIIAPGKRVALQHLVTIQGAALAAGFNSISYRVH
jgi:biopolymer transport protein ExbD